MLGIGDYPFFWAPGCLMNQRMIHLYEQKYFVGKVYPLIGFIGTLSAIHKEGGFYEFLPF